jgi:hypothetical protein
MNTQGQENYRLMDYELITSMYKNGNWKESINYRGLSVNNTLCRICTKVLQPRLQKERRSKIDEAQSDF